jgi:hypothetical protein
MEDAVGQPQGHIEDWWKVGGWVGGWEHVSGVLTLAEDMGLGREQRMILAAAAGK